MASIPSNHRGFFSWAPNNRSQAWRRAQILDSSLRKNPVKRKHFVEFMQKVLASGAAEVAPPIPSDRERWYLPLFGVYHPHKPDRIRGVFDSSAKHEGISLNQMLMTGPDLTNNLVGILLRFRNDKVAAIGDIEQMFYQFYVDTKHRDYLRFFWYENNNPDNPLIEFRMRVHVFGNSPSPTIATFGLRKTVENCDADVRKFVCENFYVDDGLISLPHSNQVVDIIKRTQEALKVNGQIRLHKIASNCPSVLTAFPKEDISSDLSTLDIGESRLPPHASLGLSWNLNNDTFVFHPLTKERPCTRRGILSSLNSVFDPIGFLCPITISGKILLREVCPSGTNWDDPLELKFQVKWKQWRDSILSLSNLSIPRMYFDISVSQADLLETYIFADASEQAIAASAYLRTIDSQGNTHVGFLMGKTKLSPQNGTTIPRLELCAAVLASELGTIITENMNILPETIKYFSDSKVVLGYLNNVTKRFHTYVSNRVSRILKTSSSDQWSFVSTHINPADCGTRFVTTINLKESAWLCGPNWLRSNLEFTKDELFPLVNPDQDKEIRSEIKTMTTSVLPSTISCFEKYSNWKKLVKSIAFLQHIAITFHQSSDNQSSDCKGWHICENYKSADSYAQAELFILKQAQNEVFIDEIKCLRKGHKLSKQSSIISLSPFLDSSGLLRVGGRLSKGFLPQGEINPIIIPKNTHIANLLIDRFHTSIKHQGRLLTEGALRRGGFWLIGAKRLVSSYIRKCVICRKLRGKLQTQKMADLPSERLTPGPPFTTVGVDTFGPWNVLTRKTRGGAANSKRWALVFTCLATRAIHIEVIETLSSSSFINALRRFQSLRGPVKVYRSDCGTNFKGATDDLNIEAINVQDKSVKAFLSDSGSVWKFNPPHSSHMGGVWERMIGLTRKI